MAALKSRPPFLWPENVFLCQPCGVITVTFSEGLSDDVKGCVQDLIARVHTWVAMLFCDSKFAGVQ